MPGSDTILDTETGAKVENLRTAEAVDLKQEEMPIGDEFREKGVGGGAAEKSGPSISTDSGDTKFSGKGNLLYESRVAKALGLPRIDLTEFRKGKLKQGEDWILFQRAVVYTDSGFLKVKAWYEKFAGAGAGDVDVRSEKEFDFLKVYRTTKNPKLLLAVGVDVEIRNRKNLPLFS